jgi:hypothetical protein
MIRPLPRRWHASYTVLPWKPKEDRMTVVIGIMADSRQSSDPKVPTSAYLLLCADTRATYATGRGAIVTSHPSHGKIYELPHGFYAGFCDDYYWSHKIATELHGRMRNVDMTSPGVRDLIQVEIKESFDYAFSWYRAEVLKKRVGITVEEYLHDNNLAQVLRERADYELQSAEQEIPSELIVVGQTHTGPMLIKANGCEVRESTEFFVSGSGALSAIAWLNFRDQRNNMSVPRSGYHQIEAKRFAQLEPTVGRSTQIVVIAPDGSSKLFHDDGVTAMSKWLDLFGLRDTQELDGEEARKLFERETGLSLPPMPSVSQTSEPEP